MTPYVSLSTALYFLEATALDVHPHSLIVTFIFKTPLYRGKQLVGLALLKVLIAPQISLIETQGKIFDLIAILRQCSFLAFAFAP
jgi:hypothetical protein